jgi:tetratricopeptide (TPR) repeat protein
LADIARHLREAAAHPALPVTMVLEQLAQIACDSGKMLRYEQAKLILVIDQLEELFTGDGVQAEERKDFVRLLAGLVRSGRVWLIATMRADFWHRAGETPELVELADGNGRLDLLPAAPSELSQMIRGPAEAADVSFETSEASGIPLSDLITEEAAREPGSLPLLSYLLDQLYQKDVLESGGSELTYASYQALGGLKGAIASRADAVLAAQPPEVRLSLRNALFALVQMSGTETGMDRAVARRALMSEFPEGSPKRRLVEALLDPSARLLVGDASGRFATVRVAHEALISEWQTARDYIAENANALRMRRAIEERLIRWQTVTREDAPGGGAGRSARSPMSLFRALFSSEHGLLTGIDLIDGQRLLRDYQSDLAPELAEFIQRSVDQDRRNHQRTVRMVSGVAVILFILTIFSGTQWLRARRQAVIAQANADTANQTTRFMVSLFDAANPETNRGIDVTVRQALDAGAATIGHDLQREPGVRAELLSAMGQAYHGLGVYDKAEELLSQARTDELAASSPIEARVRTSVASGKNLFMAGDYDKAAMFLREGVDGARRSLPESDPLRSEALAGLADALVAQGKYPEAVKLCLEALAEDRKRVPLDRAVLANTLNSLGQAYFEGGELTAAEAPYREALALREQTFGMNHTLTAESIDNLGALFYQMGRYEDAIKEYQRAMPIFNRVYREDHPEYASLLNNLGRSELMAGRLDDAEPLLRKSLSMTEKYEGKDHDDLVAPLNSLGMIDVYRGKLDAGRSELARAEAIARSRPHSNLLDQVLLNEADYNVVAGDTELAAARLKESKALLKALHPADSANVWRYAVWNTVNAEVLALNGDAVDAEKTLAAAEPIIRQRFGDTGFYMLLAERRAQFISKYKRP